MRDGLEKRETEWGQGDQAVATAKIQGKEVEAWAKAVGVKMKNNGYFHPLLMAFYFIYDFNSVTFGAFKIQKVQKDIQ